MSWSLTFHILQKKSSKLSCKDLNVHKYIASNIVTKMWGYHRKSTALTST